MEKAIKKHAVIFILPTLAAFIIGFIVPFVEGLYLSFCKFTTVGNATWVGLANYRAAITDTSFQRAFGFTVLFAVVSILSINILAFALAVLLTQKLRGTNVFRTVFFMPNLIGGIVLGYIWQIPINCVMTILEQPLLALNATAGYWGLIILMGWQQIGYMMIIYIAGLQNVPDSLIEAAEIDGAGKLQRIFKITIPMVRPTMIILVLLAVGGIFRGNFDLFYNLIGTNGTLYDVTDVIDTFTFRALINNNDIGMAAASGFFQSVLCFVTHGRTLIRVRWGRCLQPVWFRATIRIMHYFRRECDEEKKFKEVRTKKDQWRKCGRIPVLRSDSACLPDSFYHGAGSIIYFGRSDFPIWIQSVAERIFAGSI